ncbi:MAG: hypothetical protein D6824_00205 [Planctomycetota bacterium]|nr:MAG: hypothetical protein D6824_00205 [Planctomycetota bacterium]
MPWEISPEALHEALRRDPPVTLLDCREPAERAICAISPSDRFIPLAELPERLDELADVGEAPLIVYCHHGSRSLRAAQLLRRAGLSQAQSLAGGKCFRCACIGQPRSARLHRVELTHGLLPISPQCHHGPTWFGDGMNRIGSLPACLPRSRPAPRGVWPGGNSVRAGRPCGC